MAKSFTLMPGSLLPNTRRLRSRLAATTLSALTTSFQSSLPNSSTFTSPPSDMMSGRNSLKSFRHELFTNFFFVRAFSPYPPPVYFTVLIDGVQSKLIYLMYYFLSFCYYCKYCHSDFWL